MGGECLKVKGWRAAGDVCIHIKHRGGKIILMSFISEWPQEPNRKVQRCLPPVMVRMSEGKMCCFERHCLLRALF